MSALRQPDLSSQYYFPTPQEVALKEQPASVVNSSQSLVNLPKHQNKKLVRSNNFRQQNRLPQNLQLLSLLQKSSFGLAVISMIASAGLYTFTVQIPRLWSQEYRKLEDLQRQERQLIAINETLKYQIAREASQDRRLSISQPDSAVFIAPAKFQAKTLEQTANNNQTIKPLSDRSWGY